VRVARLVRLALVAFAFALAVSSASADPPFFAGGQAPCEYRYGPLGVCKGTFTVSVPASATAGLVWRLTNPLTYGDPYYVDWCPQSGGIEWQMRPAPFARPGITVSLGQIASDAEVSVAAIPQPPFSFSGLSTGNGNCETRIGFDAPHDGTYRLSFGLDSGGFAYSLVPALNNGGGSWVQVRSAMSKDYKLVGGVYEIDVRTLELGVTPWTISGDELPPQLSNARARKAVGVPGEKARFYFTSNGQGRLSADAVLNGQVVRPLISAKFVGSGEYLVAWNGLLLTGAPAPEGDYQIEATLTDDRGRSSSASVGYTLVDLPLSLARLAPFVKEGYLAPRTIPSDALGTPNVAPFADGYQLGWAGPLKIYASRARPTSFWLRGIPRGEVQTVNVGKRQLIRITPPHTSTQKGSVIYVWPERGATYALLGTLANEPTMRALVRAMR
jgi:hypothetical protein